MYALTVFKKFLFVIFGFNGSSLLIHLSLLVLSGDYSLVVVHELLIVVTSLVDHKRYSMGGSVVVLHRLSCSAACAIFPDQGSNPSSALAGRRFTTKPPMVSQVLTFF